MDQTNDLQDLPHEEMDQMYYLLIVSIFDIISFQKIFEAEVFPKSTLSSVHYEAKRLNTRLVIKSDFCNLCMYKCIIVRKKMALL